MLKAFETITSNEENTKKFQTNYRRLRKLFELLGPHPIKLEKLKDLLALPSSVIPVAVASLGWPGEDPGPRTRFNSAYLHLEKW